MFVIVLTFDDKYLFEGRDMVLLEVLLEHVHLEFSEFVVIHEAIVISVAYPEDAQEGPLKFRLQCLTYRVMQWSYGEQDGFLGTRNDVD